MKLLADFFPTVIFSTHSPFSGEIKIVDFRGEKRLMVGDLVQSITLEAPAEHKVWGRLAHFPDTKRKDLRVLILGLGGGTVAQLVSRQLNPSRFVGVEIDPVIVELGKQFFGLGKIKNLEIVVADVQDYLSRTSEKFDFIVVDTYRGDLFPGFWEKPFFLIKLRSLLTEDGHLVFNRIFYQSRPAKRLSFLKKLSSVFGHVDEEIIESPSDAKNYLYYVRAEGSHLQAECR